MITFSQIFRHICHVASKSQNVGSPQIMFEFRHNPARVFHKSRQMFIFLWFKLLELLAVYCCSPIAGGRSYKELKYKAPKISECKLTKPKYIQLLETDAWPRLVDLEICNHFAASFKKEQDCS